MFDTYRFKVKANPDWDEYVVLVWKNGKRYPAADYFTDDKEDAINTMHAMREQAMANGDSVEK